MPFTASVIPAKDWGAKPPKEWPDITRPQYIVIHHTATPNPPNDLSGGTLDGAKALARSIQKSHMDGFGWNDSGHNFLNTTGAYLLEGRQGSLDAVKRGFCVRSAHAGKTVGNESPGIENEGTFTSYHMNAKQWNSLVELCASICSSCKIDPNNIKGHRDFIETQCPGDWLYSQLSKLRSDVRQRLDPNAFADYLKEGSTGPKVVDLQQRLKAKGFNPGPIDGIFGSGTLKAVISFQKYNGLYPDGIVGPQTWKVLTSTSTQKAAQPTLLQATDEQPAAMQAAAVQPSPVKVLDTYKYYRGLPHQDQAIEWLQGKLSAQTLAEFSDKWRTTPSQPFLPLLEGATGTDVQKLQQLLHQKGFDPGTIDGVFGAKTKAAVIAFQKAKGITVDGIVGDKTWTTLNLS